MSQQIAQSNLTINTVSSSNSRINIISVWDTIGSLAKRRMQILTYLKRIHTSKTLYFNTTLIRPQDFNQDTLHKQALQWFYLGISLGHILTLQMPNTYLRSLIALMQEYEYDMSDPMRQKFAQIFKKSMKQPSTAASSEDPFHVYPAFLDTGLYSYFMMPNVPFELDYVEVVQSLCEILCESYRKLCSFREALGGTAGLKSPMSLVVSMESEGINGNSAVQDTLFLEAVLKYDAKVMKVVESMVKPLDAIATSKIERELKLFNLDVLPQQQQNQ